MAKKPYIPVHVRKAKGEEQYSVLHEGVPEWMKPSLWSWCEQHLWEQNPMAGGRDPNKEVINYLERVLRVRLVLSPRRSYLFDPLRQQMAENPDLFLSMVEALLQPPFSGDLGATQALKQILEEAGSAYELSGNDRDGFFFQQRVAPPVKAAYEETLSHAGRAGQHLEAAWKYVYQRKPDPTAGYREAVRAVEAVTCPLVPPKDKKATLGTVIRQMREASDKFEVSLQPQNSDAISKVRALCELIWKSQLDRHGTADPQVPLNVSKEEAEMALHAAVTLVHWFSRGMVKLKA